MSIKYKGKLYYSPQEVGDLYPLPVQGQTVMRHARKLKIVPVKFSNKNYFTEGQKDTLVGYNAPDTSPEEQ